MFNFYVIYSLNIVNELFNELNELEFEDLVEESLNYNIDLNLPEFDEEKYNDIVDFYYDNDITEEGLIESILISEEYQTKLQQIINDNLNPYIINNSELFTCTEKENNYDEYGTDTQFIHRKYVAVLNSEQFVKFINNTEVESICDTMGSMTEYGVLPAFCIEPLSYNNLMESTYISVMFNKELTNDEMVNCEDQIKDWIEEGELTVEKLENIVY